VGEAKQRARAGGHVLAEHAARVVEVAAQRDAGRERDGPPAGERVVVGAGHEPLERALEAAGRVVVIEGAAVRVDVADDAVLGVVDLARRQRDGAVRGGEGPRGRLDAAAGVVGERDAARVIVDARELAARVALAVVGVLDLADLAPAVPNERSRRSRPSGS
jgi:hypothetical protein